MLADAVLEHLPPDGALLDVGCASGGLLELVGERARLRVGIELSEAAARDARAHADHVLVGDIEDPSLTPPGRPFDVVVLADVLEHLRDPVAVLRRAAGWVVAGGSVVVSVPNIAYWRARLVHLRGRWPQDDSGLFDASHLRCFTTDILRDAVAQAGLRIVALQPVVPAMRHTVPAVERLPGRVEAAVEHAWRRAGLRRPGAMGYQLVAVARRVPLTATPAGPRSRAAA